MNFVQCYYNFCLNPSTAQQPLKTHSQQLATDHALFTMERGKCLKKLAVAGSAFIFLIASQSSGWAAGAESKGGASSLQAKSLSLWEALQAGGFVMIPLAILSILTLGLVLIYLFALRKRNIASKRFLQTADALAQRKDYFGLIALANQDNQAIAKVLQPVVEFLTRHPKASPAEVREIAETEGNRQVAALNQQVVFLADIGALAPMLGLLGTIFGMIKSFGAVAGDVAATRATFLSQGIAEALIATATGLIIGIVAMAAYSFFRGRVQALTSELEGASTRLLASLTAQSLSSHAQELTFTRKNP